MQKPRRTISRSVSQLTPTWVTRDEQEVLVGAEAQEINPIVRNISRIKYFQTFIKNLEGL